METVHLSRLRPGPNPRSYYDPASMQELIDSVKQRGVLQPIIVRPLPESDAFQIIAGERRYRAAQEAFNGDYHVPVVIKDVGDEEADSIALTENCIRDDMGIVAEAIAAQKLVLRNSGDKDEAARSLGWSREKLERRLAILHCVKEVRQALDERRIQVGHGELLATVAPERQAGILEKVLAHNVGVADLRAQLAQFSQSLADAIFDQAAAGCANCVHNSSRQATLFAEHIALGRCTHPAHYVEMTEAALAAKVAALKEAVPMVQVIRPSDAFVRIRIVADGDGAVGEEQAQACRGCANFGCAVSALPGSLGVVHHDNCFDQACNLVKRAQHLKTLQAARAAEQAAATGTSGTPKSAPTGAAGAPGAKQPAPTASSAAVTRGVAEFRVAQWRQMLAATLAADRTLAQRFLLAVVASGNARWLDADALGRAAKKLGVDLGRHGSPQRLLQATDSIDATALDGLAAMAPAAAAFGIDEDGLQHALEWAQVDEAKHLRVTKEYLTLLTKSEIESTCSEIGLTQHLGKAAVSKLVSGKKDALIAGVLGAKGFDFEGKVPKVLRYRRRART